MRLGGRVGQLVFTVLVPLLAGAALAAFCVLTFTAFSTEPSFEANDHQLLSAKHSQPNVQQQQRDVGVKGRYERLVASAAAHEVGAEQQAAHAVRLRTEAENAKTQAEELQN